MVEIGRSTDSERGQAGKILEYFMGRLEHLQPLYRVDTVRFPVERELCPPHLQKCRNLIIAFSWYISCYLRSAHRYSYIIAMRYGAICSHMI